MCVCFKFKLRVVVPGTKHKQKQKAQTKSNSKSKNEPKSTLYRCFSVFVGCVCAQRYSRYSSTPAASSSSSLSRRVRIKRLSLANWASLSAERKTKPSQRDRERDAKRARAPEWAFAFYELLWNMCECVHCDCEHDHGSLTLIKLDTEKTYRITRAAAPAAARGPCPAGKTRSLWGDLTHNSKTKTKIKKTKKKKN